MKANIMKLISALPRRFPFRLVALVLVFATLAAFTVVSGSALGEDQKLPKAVTVFADGEQIALPETPATVAHALHAAGLVLSQLDRVEPALGATLQAGDEIRVTRVETGIISEMKREAYDTVVLADPELRPGIILKVREGREGTIRRQTRVWKKDGVETLREAINSVRLQEKTDAVEIRGTSGFTSRGGLLRRALTMNASAYDPGPRSCGKYADGYTSTGLKAGKGVVAVDPRVIPLGSRLYVADYGFAIAGDVGSAIKGNRIDLGYNTYAEAIRFGRRQVKVYLLD